MSTFPSTPPAVSQLTDINSATKRRREEVNNQTWEPWESSLETESGQTANSLTLGSAVRLLMGQFTETRAMIDGLRNDINAKIDTVKSELEVKLNDVKVDINSLKAECSTKFETNDAALKSINERFGSISQNVGALEFRNELIISGIPYQTTENLYSYLQAICKELLPTATTNQVASCRRMKLESLKNGDESLVVVEFALKSTRDEVYSAYLRRCDLKLRHIGINSDRRVYINENLDISARKVKSAALQLKKAGKLASVYTNKGIVHVKKTGGVSSVAVHSEEDLNKFT